MIPHRLTLKNFLCYADEQSYDFESAPLWVLAGPNGSGKSAVFDGMTYALFGAHRLGEQRFRELIHRGKDRLDVTFEFSVGVRRYRIRRSYGKRGQPTQQVWACTCDPSCNEDWEAVPSTSTVDGVNGWVETELGLNYKTFTSSVLLLQGGAEKLIGGKPKERFEVMQGIVDVERYQRLHERVIETRRKHGEERGARQLQLNTIPEVTEAQVEEAEAEVRTATTALAEAQGEVERWQGLVAQAGRWKELDAQASQFRGQIQAQEERLADAAAIEVDWGRFQHLKEVLGPLRTALDYRLRLERSLGTQADLRAKREGLLANVSASEVNLRQCEQKRDALEASLKRLRERSGQVALRRRELTTVLDQVRALEQLREELREVEEKLAELPQDLPTQCEAAQAEVGRLSALREALPSLRRLCEERSGLRDARGRFDSALIQERAAGEVIELLEPALEALDQEVQVASDAERKAGEDVASAEALLRQAGEKRSSFEQLSGAETCSACGQRLTPTHITKERGRLEAEKRAKEQALREATAAQARAAGMLADLAARRQGVTDECSSAKEEERKHGLTRTLAEKDATRHTKACKRAYADLAESFRTLVAAAEPEDWLQTTYPTEDDIASATERLGEEATVRQRAKTLQGQCQFRTGLETEQTTKAALLSRQAPSLPADVSALETEDQTLLREETSLAGLTASDEEVLAEAKKDIERLSGECQTLRGEIIATDLLMKGEEARAEEYARGLKQAREGLPENVRALADRISEDELEELEEELQTLTERGAESRHQELARARMQIEPLRGQLRDCESAQEAIPTEARRSVAEVEVTLQGAKQQQTDAGTRLRTAEQQRDRFVRFKAERGEAETAYRRADRQHHLCGLLADLLSREGLQLHLVRQAERAIVEIANEILDRLSGGDLSLHLRETKETGGEALHLTARYRPVSDEPYDLALLSGSQRFRVAVSLALAIGQYASRQQRPLQSVIIDEGFGCLDRVGRQGMIQELINLKEHLSRTVLVSHLEEFAESFSDGYLLELRDGATYAASFHRS